MGKKPVMLAAADKVANSARKEKLEKDKWAAQKILDSTVTSLTNTAKIILDENVEEESIAETVQSNRSCKSKQSQSSKRKGRNYVQRSAKQTDTKSEKTGTSKEKQDLRDKRGSKMNKGRTAARNFVKNLKNGRRRRKRSSSSRASNTEEEYWLYDLVDRFDLFCGQFCGEDDADYYDHDDDTTVTTSDSYDTFAFEV